MTEPQPLEFSHLNQVSRDFASRLFDRLPALKEHARMVPRPDEEEFDLLVEVPSPSGDPKRQLVLWIDEEEEPSLGFGEWHTHASVATPCGDFAEQDQGLIDLAKAILADKVVLTYDIGGEHDGAWGLLDLRSPDALLEELTDKYSPGRVRIRTWTGRGDREVGLEDLSED